MLVTKSTQTQRLSSWAKTSKATSWTVRLSQNYSPKCTRLSPCAQETAFSCLHNRYRPQERPTGSIWFHLYASSVFKWTSHVPRNSCRVTISRSKVCWRRCMRLIQVRYHSDQIRLHSHQLASLTSELILRQQIRTYHFWAIAMDHNLEGCHQAPVVSEMVALVRSYWSRLIRGMSVGHHMRSMVQRLMTCYKKVCQLWTSMKIEQTAIWAHEFRRPQIARRNLSALITLQWGCLSAHYTVVGNLKS